MQPGGGEGVPVTQVGHPMIGGQVTTGHSVMKGVVTIGHSVVGGQVTIGHSVVVGHSVIRGQVTTGHSVATGHSVVVGHSVTVGHSVVTVGLDRVECDSEAKGPLPASFSPATWNVYMVPGSRFLIVTFCPDVMMVLIAPSD